MVLKYFVLPVLFCLIHVDSSLSAHNNSRNQYIKKHRDNSSDMVSPDEQPQKYEALDLQDVCKNTKNPKCEAIIDNFCAKTCSTFLCATYGSVRGMCRLICEGEDLLPECIKRGPSQITVQPPPPVPY